MRSKRELIAIRAAERLAEALAKANGSDCAALLLTVAILQAEEELGLERANNAVVMCQPLKVILNGHGVEITPRGDDGPRKESD